MFIIIVDWSNWHGRYLIHSFAMAYRPKTPVVLQPKLRSPQAENPLHSLALCTCLHWFLLDSGTGASVAMQGPEHLVSCNQFRILCDILFGWLWVTSVANAALRVSSCTVLVTRSSAFALTGGFILLWYLLLLKEFGICLVEWKTSHGRE